MGQSSSFITKINFPKIALVQSPVLVSFVDFAVRFVLLGITMIILKTSPHGLFFSPANISAAHYLLCHWNRDVFFCYRGDI